MLLECWPCMHAAGKLVLEGIHMRAAGRRVFARHSSYLKTATAAAAQ